jgi:hypothetical protein
MNRTICRTVARCLPLACLITVTSVAFIARAQQWTAPTAEELSMTSQPEVPGAAAVYLFKEEITDDKLHMWSKYARIKVLTEAGKDYANVELVQHDFKDRYGDDAGFTVNSIAGRTIHPDGTIIPFAGKVLDKLIQKDQDSKEIAKVFTLPDVEVGSIIEYRYQLSYDENFLISPDWYIQSDLYTRKAHYLWRPSGQVIGIAWTPILPKGSTVVKSQLSGNQFDAGQMSLELNIRDVLPAPDEEYMPPVASLSYRVLFYYTDLHSDQEFWKVEGKAWAKQQDKFIGPDSKVKAAVKELVAASDTQEQKLRKIYAAVMKLDNTSFNRERSAAEDKAQGLGAVKNADDVWERRRGINREMAQLLVAMARAAGMKAYLMAVTSRDRNLFLPAYLSFSQLDDAIAIVDVDGKEQFFDPGERYCPYGQLAWKHTLVRGIRQTDADSALDETPVQSYKDSRTDRVADLTMDEHGEGAGTVTMIYRGAPALSWRQVFLRGDATSLNRDLEEAVEKLMPAGMDVKVKSVDKLEDYEEPLTVQFDVKGQIASPTGKRLLVPSDIFEVNTKPVFPHENRELPVYFEYGSSVMDAMRVTFPRSLSVESLPAADQEPFEQSAFYAIKAESNPISVTVHRNLLLGGITFSLDQYPALRAFYNKFESKDQEPVVLKAANQAEGLGSADLDKQ